MKNIYFNGIWIILISIIIIYFGYSYLYQVAPVAFTFGDSEICFELRNQGYFETYLEHAGHNSCGDANNYDYDCHDKLLKNNETDYMLGKFGQNCVHKPFDFIFLILPLFISLIFWALTFRPQKEIE